MARHTRQGRKSPKPPRAMKHRVVAAWLKKVKKKKSKRKANTKVSSKVVVRFS